MSREALEKRYNQGWLMQISDNLDEIISIIRKARRNKQILSLGYHGNVVDLWYVLILFYIKSANHDISCILNELIVLWAWNEL